MLHLWFESGKSAARAMSSGVSGQTKDPQQQGVAALTAAAAVGGAARSTKIAGITGNKIDGPLKEQPQQQRKGRSKKKRGKAGGGICAVDGPSTAAVAAAAGSIDGPPKQKKKRRQQKKQARKQRQQPEHHEDAEEHEQQQLPSRDLEREQDQATAKAVCPKVMMLPREPQGAAAARRGAETEKGALKTADVATGVAPFECSWTNVPGSGDNDKDTTGHQGKVFIARSQGRFGKSNMQQSVLTGEYPTIGRSTKDLSL